MDKKCLRKKLDMNEIRKVREIFGEKWDKFLADCAHGDEVWEYNDISFLSGSMGYVIVRGDQYVSWFRTAVS